MLIQLDLFETKSESDILREELSTMQASNDKLRKSLYSRHGDLAKRCISLEERLAVIEKYICKNKLDEIIRQ